MTSDINNESPLVLIVDDEPLALDMAEMTLLRNGFRAIKARGGEEGLALVFSENPDIVLLDITMPDIDGFEVFQKIRNKQEYESLPVIFVTARDDLEHKVKGLELGAIDYITKPYFPNELIARVKTTLRLQRLEREAGERSQEEARRKAVETLLITMNHYINNAIAAIQGFTKITPPDNVDAVEKMLKVVSRQSKVVTATIKSIEEMLEEVKIDTASYAYGDAQILNIEEKVKRWLDELESREKGLDNLHE